MKIFQCCVFPILLGTSASLYSSPGLLKAATKGNLDAVKTCVSAGDAINRADNNGWTPLMWASYGNHTSVVRYLLEMNADPNIQSTGDSNISPKGSTALTMASYYGLVDVVALLVKHKAKLDLVDTNGNTAAHIAKRHSCYEVLKVLADNGSAFAKNAYECIKSVSFIDEKSLNKPYKIVGFVTRTESNGYEDKVVEFLKRKACEAGGNVLTNPDVIPGPRNTTYISKIIAWDIIDNKSLEISNNCLKNMYFVDEKNEKKSFKIIDFLRKTEPNGSDEEVIEYFKTKACEVGGDALTMPDIQVGSRNTTYTCKIIAWDVPKNL